MTAVVVAIMILVSKRRRKNLSTTGSSIYSGPYTNTAYSHSSMSRRSWGGSTSQRLLLVMRSVSSISSVTLGHENSTTDSWDPLPCTPLLVIAVTSSISSQHISAITSSNKKGLVYFPSYQGHTPLAQPCVLVNKFNSTNKMWFKISFPAYNVWETWCGRQSFRWW